MKKWFAAIFTVCLLTACSTKMSYYFLDWAIEWQIEDYVSFDRTQEVAFDRLIDEFIVWHQSQELPRYVNQLTQLSTQIRAGQLTPTLWEQHVTDAKAHWSRLFQFALPELLPLIASLSDEQVKQVIAQFERDERDLVKEFAGKNAEQLVADSDERLQEQFHEWLGSVSTAQKQLIHDYNAHRLSTLDMWLEYRHEWLRQFVIALKEREDREALTSRLTLLMTQPDELKSDIHKQKLSQNTQAFGAMLNDIYQSLSVKQNTHFHNKLAALIEDLSELAQDANKKD